MATAKKVYICPDCDSGDVYHLRKENALRCRKCGFIGDKILFQKKEKKGVK